MTTQDLLTTAQDAELLTLNETKTNRRRLSSGTHQHKNNTNRRRNSYFHNFIIFFAGLLVALVFYELTQAGDLSNFLLRTQHKKRLQYLPTEHELIAHDDASYFAKLNNIKEQYGTAVIKRRSKTATKNPDNESNLQEALSALRLAQEMRVSGKDDKAQRLFEHAYALAPRHPEILLRYGEYLEYNERDVVLADQYYFQALILNPSNNEALNNRQRTAAIVQSIDERHLQILDEKRDALSAVSESNAALRRAKKEAYFQHIYHSVGIEGNTMSLAETRQILETRMAVDGKSIDEHNEILGLDAAMKFINASLVNKLEISIKDILEMHRRVLGHVDPIEGGEFRRTQVYVGGHVPPGPGDLSILMKRFELWLNSDQTMSLHPVQ